MFEFDDTFRAGIGIDAVVNKGLFIVESILSFPFVSLPNELLPKYDGSAGELGPFESGGDNSKSGDEASNFKKLFEELQS